MSTINTPITKAEGWKEAATKGSGFFSASSDCQYWIATSKPDDEFYGHSVNTMNIKKYTLTGLERLYVKSSGDLTLVITSSDLQAIVSRFYTTLDSVLQNYWKFEKTLKGQVGDKFKFKFLAPNAVVTSSHYVTDGDNVIPNNRAYVVLQTDGTYLMANNITVEVDGVTVDTNSAYPVDGKFHEIEYTLTAPADIKYLSCRYSVASFYSGMFADFEATLSGVTQTYPLSKGKGSANDTEYNLENAFGADLATVSPAVIDADWIEVDKRNYTVDGTSIALSHISFPNTLSLGKMFEINVRVYDYVSGLFRVGGANGASPTLEKNGYLSWLYTPEQYETLKMQSVLAGGEFKIEIVSIREVSGNAITRVAVKDDNVNEMTLIDGVWIGQELVVNGNFTTDSDWSKGTGWAIGGGVADFSGGTQFSVLSQALPNTARSITTFDLVSITGHSSQSMRVTASDTIFYGTNDALGTKTLIGTGSVLQFQSRDAVSTMVVDNVSVKRIIEVAS